MIETPLSPPKGKLENPTPSASCVNASASDVHHRQTQRVNKKYTSIFDSATFSRGTTVENVSLEARRGSEGSAAGH